MRDVGSIAQSAVAAKASQDRADALAAAREEKAKALKGKQAEKATETAKNTAQAKRNAEFNSVYAAKIISAIPLPARTPNNPTYAFATNIQDSPQAPKDTIAQGTSFGVRPNDLPKDQWLAPKPVLVTAEGQEKPVQKLASYNKTTGQYRIGDKIVPASQVAPIPKQDRATTVYDKEGNIVYQETLGNSPLQKPVKTSVQKKIIENEVTLGSLRDMKKGFKDKFQQIPHRLYVGISKIEDMLGFTDISDEQRAAITELSAHQSKTVAATAAYIKSQSGLAVSDKEFRRLKIVMPNKNDSPVEFQSKLDTVMNRLDRSNTLYRALLDAEPNKTPSLDTIDDNMDGELSEDMQNKVGDYMLSEMRKINPEATEADVAKLMRQRGMI
jgi:hypothetical protein